jgi:hypothetical protein
VNWTEKDRQQILHGIQGCVRGLGGFGIIYGWLHASVPVAVAGSFGLELLGIATAVVVLPRFRRWLAARSIHRPEGSDQ